MLTWSILLYAVSAFVAGFSTSIYMLLFFRCTTFIGVCVEFVAAVAWLAELFPNHTQREVVLGTTQAFSSIGGLLVAMANGIAVAWAVGKPAPLLFGLTLPAVGLPAIVLPDWLAALLGGAIQDPHAAWRYTLMSGLIPAIPLIVIRPFLPESPAWKAKKDAGTLEAAESGRVVRAAAAPHDDRHDHHVRLQLWRGLRRDPADPADRSRPAASPEDDGREENRCRRSGKSSKPSPPTSPSGRSSAGCSAALRWRYWPR